MVHYVPALLTASSNSSYCHRCAYYLCNLGATKKRLKGETTFNFTVMLGVIIRAYHTLTEPSSPEICTALTRYVTTGVCLINIVLRHTCYFVLHIVLIMSRSSHALYVVKTINFHRTQKFFILPTRQVKMCSFKHI